MSSETAEVRVPCRIVLGDANVLYSRVLRDYLLYAMTKRIIPVVVMSRVPGVALGTTRLTPVQVQALTTALRRLFSAPADPPAETRPERFGQARALARSR